MGGREEGEKGKDGENEISRDKWRERKEGGKERVGDWVGRGERERSEKW